MSENQGMTMQEIADKLQVEKTNAYGFIKVLEAYGLAKVSGSRPSQKGGKGKPSTLYQVNLDGEAVLKLVTILQK